MKRFVGWICATFGLVGTGWGGYHMLTGASKAQINLSPDIAVTALSGGLIGLLFLTIGLIWIRD